MRPQRRDARTVANGLGGLLFVVGRIDGAEITKPTGLRMLFALREAGMNFYTSYDGFTLVGYADGVAAGSDTLAFVYDTQSGVIPATFSRFIDSEPFVIEINEVS